MAGGPAVQYLAQTAADQRKRKNMAVDEEVFSVDSAPVRGRRSVLF